MNKICSVDNCNLKILAKSFCSKHYYKTLKYGDPLKGYTKIPDGERVKFIQTIINSEKEECIIWPFSDNGVGYGTVIIDGVKWYAHRYILFIKNYKEDYKNLDVRHSCGKGHLGCVNPNHLSWGTRKENFEDKKLHGTYKRGTEMPGNILSEIDVIEIVKLLKEKNKFQREIADQFGCVQQTISNINTGKIWGWLTEDLRNKNDI